MLHCVKIDKFKKMTLYVSNILIEYCYRLRNIPQSYPILISLKAIVSTKEHEWRIAIEEEYEALSENKTFHSAYFM